VLIYPPIAVLLGRGGQAGEESQASETGRAGEAGGELAASG
jgi:hypothetical protein